MLHYVITVYGAPYSTQTHHTALSFVRATLKKGHIIKLVFFYNEAVRIGSVTAEAPSQYQNLRIEWVKLSQKHAIPLVLCSASTQREGITLPTLPLQNTSQTTLKSFTIGGLGTFIEAFITSDRLIEFK